MIGQAQLQAKLQSYSTLQLLPKVNLVVGQAGSGRHTFIKEIADKYHLSALPFTLNDSFDEAALSIRYIDLAELALKDQAKLIALTEQPPLMCWLFIIGEHLDLINKTLVGKCEIWLLKPYTQDELTTFLPHGADMVQTLQIAHTPGQVLKANQVPELFKLCETIVEKMSLANFANALTLANKIAYKGEADKFDLDLFFNCMLQVTAEKNQEDLFLITLDYQKKSRYKRLVLQNLVESYIIDLWRNAYGYSRT